jgi:hypothetical protein
VKAILFAMGLLIVACPASSSGGRVSLDARGPDCNPAAKESAACCTPDGEWRCKQAVPEGAKP